MFASHYTDETQLRSIAATIIDLFEDLLEKNNVTLPDIYRMGDPDESRIFVDTTTRWRIVLSVFLKDWRLLLSFRRISGITDAVQRGILYDNLHQRSQSIQS